MVANITKIYKETGTWQPYENYKYALANKKPNEKH